MKLATIALPAGESFLEVETVSWFAVWWRENRPGWVDLGWWAVPVREDLLPILARQPGPELAAALKELPAGVTGDCPAQHERDPVLDDAGYPCACKVVIAAAWEAVASWVGVQSAGALVNAVGPGPVVLRTPEHPAGVEDPAREELAAALRLPGSSLALRMRRARALRAQPQAAGLAEDGVLPLANVMNICMSMVGLDPGDAADVVQEWSARVRACERSGRPMSGQRAANAATRRIMKAPSHRKKRKKAREERRVELWRNDDGTATLAATLCEEDALRAHRRLSAIARGLDDDRPIDAKRADVLVDLLLGSMPSQASGIEVNVTVSLAALLGLADGDAEVPGFGPIPLEVARALAADGRWRAWATGTQGQVITTSSTTYRPSAALQRLVRARDPECRMTGCRQPAQRCEIDHAVPWPRGETTAANLGPLCVRHHVMKTHVGWDLRADEEHWVSPAGMGVAFDAA